jgi:hypothetical protein
MISPATVITHLIDQLKSIQDDLGLTDIFEGTEDSTEAAAPYCFGYYDFEDQAEIGAHGYANKIPVNLNFIVVSADHKTVSGSFNEVLTAALKIMNKLTDDFFLINTEGNDEPVEILSNRLPLRILNKSAARSAIEVRLQYIIPTPYGG